MNYTIRQIIRRVITPPNQPAVMLGRWRLTYSEKVLEKTIERANERSLRNLCKSSKRRKH